MEKLSWSHHGSGKRKAATAYIPLRGVTWLHYLPDRNELHCWGDGGTTVYSNVTEKEALQIGQEHVDQVFKNKVLERVNSLQKEINQTLALLPDKIPTEAG
jgi:hypothetical protein